MHERFKKVLAEYCSDKDVVVGAPAGFFFEGEHHVLRGGLACIQQLPRRVWVGLKYEDEPVRDKMEPIRIPGEAGYHQVWLPGTGLKDFRHLLPVRGSTEWSVRTKSIERLVNALLARPSIQEFWDLDGLPFTVHILSEMRSASGCNFSGAFSVALMTALRLAAEQFGTVKQCVLTEQVSSEGQDGVFPLDWGGGVEDQLKNPHSDLHRINRAALVLETYFHGGSASGYGTICSFVPTKWPMLYMREGADERGVPTRLLAPERWEALDEDDWAYLEEKLLHPEHGLQYELIRLSHTPAWPDPPPVTYPVSFGLLFSGMPKDTAKAIARVINSGTALSQSLTSRLSFLRDDRALRRRLEKRAVPVGLKILDELTKNVDAALDMMYAALGPVGYGVIHNLLHCFDLHSASREVQEQAVARFVETIWGAQGGLDQLFLVDEQARWIAGKLVDCFKDAARLHALKYTGGSRGGYLLWVGPRDADLRLLEQSLANSPLLAGEAGLTAPSFDYHSDDEEPDGRGVCVYLPAKPRQLERWPMICYAAAESGWRLDPAESRAGVYECDWKRMVARSRQLQHQGWCLLELDYRDRTVHRKVRSQVLFQGVSLGKLKTQHDLPGTTKGEDAAAHAMLAVLDEGGRCELDAIHAHLQVANIGAKAYFPGLRKHILREVESFGPWSNVFGPPAFPTVGGSYGLGPSSETSRVLVYLRHYTGEPPLASTRSAVR